MKRMTSALRVAARTLLWLGGMVWGIALVDGAVPALTVAFLSTIIALLTLQHLDKTPERSGPDW